MSKIKMDWIDYGWVSLLAENPHSQKAYQRAESKRINHQVKQINRNQQRIMLKQFGKTR